MKTIKTITVQVFRNTCETYKVPVEDMKDVDLQDDDAVLDFILSAGYSPQDEDGDVDHIEVTL